MRVRTCDERFHVCVSVIVEGDSDVRHEAI
jgi:hypothetical protein